MHSCTTEPKVPARVDAMHGSGKGSSVCHVTQTSLQLQHAKQRLNRFDLAQGASNGFCNFAIRA